MLFDDSTEKIWENLSKYVKNGGTPYCAKFDYFSEFESLIDVDRKNLEYSFSMVGKNCVTAFYDDNVDAKCSGLNLRVHNGNLLKLIGQKMGKKANKFVHNVGLKDIKLLPQLLYGTTYTPLIRDFGGDLTGLCLCGNNDCLLLYTSSFSSLNAVQNFYHEVGHAVSFKLNLDKHNNEVLKLLEKRANSASPENKPAAQKICDNERDYIKYVRESYAEVFSVMMTLLRTKTEREYQLAAASLMENAAMRAVVGCGDALEGSDVSAYNAYPAIKQVLQMLDNLGRKGRGNFANENGVLSMEKVAKLSFSLVQNTAMSREDYKNYRNTNRNQVDRYQGCGGYSWVNDVMEAQDMVESNPERLYLNNFIARLSRAKSQRQVYDAFHNSAQEIPEVLSLYEVYKQNNYKAMMYEKLRKAQQAIGVEKLLGLLARKRRALGARVMNHINGGRD